MITISAVEISPDFAYSKIFYTTLAPEEDRDKAKAGRIAADLAVRSPASTITVVETDFLDAAAIGQNRHDHRQACQIMRLNLARAWSSCRQGRRLPVLGLRNRSGA